MSDKGNTKYRFNHLSDFKMPEETNHKKEGKAHAAETEAALATEKDHQTLTLLTNQTTDNPKKEKTAKKSSAKSKNKKRSVAHSAVESIQTDQKDSLELTTHSGMPVPSSQSEQKTDDDKTPLFSETLHNNGDIQENVESSKPKHMTINDLPDDEKPREKMLERGADALSNAELLAVIIGSGTKSANESLTAVELSQKILRHFGGDLTELCAASAEELYRDDNLLGIGVAKACKIKAALELGRRAHIPKKPLLKISSSQEAADYLMPDMKNLKQEEFVVLLLDSKNHLFKKERVTKGTVNASLVTPREVFAFAVRQHATGIIVAHNHPSGDPTPSQADKAVTKELIESGKVLNIPLLDHIIIGNDYFSFLEEGILY